MCVLDPAGRQVAGFAVGTPRSGSTAWSGGWPARCPGRGTGRVERPDGRLVDALLAPGTPWCRSADAIKTWRGGCLRGQSDPVTPTCRRVPRRAPIICARRPLTEHTTALRPCPDLARSWSPPGRGRHQLAALLTRLARARGCSPMCLGDQPGVPDPLPQPSARHHARGAVAAFLIKHGYSAPHPRQLLTRCAPHPPAPPARRRRALRDAVLAMSPCSPPSTPRSRSGVAPRTARAPDGEIFTSFPGGCHAAQIRAELAEHSAYTGPEAIAALAGLVPVTRPRQTPRRELPLGLQQAPARGDHDLRRQLPPRQHLGRGHLRRPRQREGASSAVRILARAWVRVIWRCWIDQQPYDPARHGGAAQQLAPPTAA